MKKSFLFLFFIGLLAMSWAQPINLSIMGNGFYNSLKATSLDASNPAGQPILFNINVQNPTSTPYSLHFTFAWNNTELLNTYFKAKAPYNSLNLTSRDMITTTASMQFDAPNPSLTFSDIIKKSSSFEDVVLNTGKFPDGRYMITVQAVTTDQTHAALSAEKTFVITLLNTNAIYLNRPGAVTGSAVPVITGKPLVFLWNSNMANVAGNAFTLTIKQFNSAADLNPGSVESGGILFKELTGLTSNSYSDMLPFENGRYYAWQISVPYNTPDAPPGTNLKLKSPFYVFQYADNYEASQNMLGNQIMSYLMNLGNSEIINLLNDGYLPTGVISVGNRSLSASEASAFMNGLSSKRIKSIRIDNN